MKKITPLLLVLCGLTACKSNVRPDVATEANLPENKQCIAHVSAVGCSAGLSPRAPAMMRQDGIALCFAAHDYFKSALGESSYITQEFAGFINRYQLKRSDYQAKAQELTACMEEDQSLDNCDVGIVNLNKILREDSVCSFYANRPIESIKGIHRKDIGR